MAKARRKSRSVPKTAEQKGAEAALQQSQRIALEAQRQRTAQSSRGGYRARQLRAGGTSLGQYDLAKFKSDPFPSLSGGGGGAPTGTPTAASQGGSTGKSKPKPKPRKGTVARAAVNMIVKNNLLSPKKKRKPKAKTSTRKEEGRPRIKVDTGTGVTRPIGNRTTIS